MSSSRNRSRSRRRAVDEITAAAEKAGVKVAAIFQGRFGSGAQTVKTAIEAGRLGRLVLASAYIKWHRTTEYYQTAWKGTWDLDGGGALMNQAIHGVDLLQWFAGLPARSSARSHAASTPASRRTTPPSPR
jgi:predicted dehydrogenase